MERVERQADAHHATMQQTLATLNMSIQTLTQHIQQAPAPAAAAPQVTSRVKYSDPTPFDGKDKDEKQDTRVCQRQSPAFASLMQNESPEGGKQWAIQNSLYDLAEQNLLNSKQNEAPIKTPQDFVKTIKNRDLQALVSGRGNVSKKIPQDSAFLPTLWAFKLTSATTPKQGGTPSGASSPPPSQPITPPQQTAPTNINVTCQVTTALTCNVARAFS